MEQDEKEQGHQFVINDDIVKLVVRVCIENNLATLHARLEHIKLGGLVYLLPYQHFWRISRSTKVGQCHISKSWV